MKKLFFERECVHRDKASDGEVYNGMFFIQALQRLQSDALCAVDDLGRQVFVLEAGYKLGKLSTQRHDGSFREDGIGLS